MNGTLRQTDLDDVSATTGDRKTARILCVDDDPDISRAIQLRLSEYQVDVVRAFFGIQGFWDAITESPDLIIMDLAMPNGDGRFMLQSLRNNPEIRNVPVIILTGMRNHTLKNEMFNLGADQFLTKPIRFDELIHEINRFVTLTKRDHQNT